MSENRPLNRNDSRTRYALSVAGLRLGKAPFQTVLRVSQESVSLHSIWRSGIVKSTR